MTVNDDMREAVAKDVSYAVARTVAKGVALFVGFVVFIVVGGFVVQLLWNWLLPPILGLREVTFWQALGLLTLSRILFGESGTTEVVPMAALAARAANGGGSVIQPQRCAD